MAAIDLSAVNSYPWVYTATAIGTTWQEFIRPTRCRTVTVLPEGEAGRLAFDSNGDPASAEAPADGGAVGTHRVVIPADGSIDSTVRRAHPLGASASFFVARASTSGTVTIILED